MDSAWGVRGLCAWGVHGQFVHRPSTAPGQPVDSTWTMRLWGVGGQFTSRTWIVLGHSVGHLWAVCGVCMDSAWTFRVQPVGRP